MTVKDITLGEALNLMEEDGYDLEEQAIRNKFARWINEGRHVLIFENHDLSSLSVGHKIAMPWDPVEPLPPHGPDTVAGLGWRYLTSYIVRAPATAQADVDAYNEAVRTGYGPDIEEAGDELLDTIHRKDQREATS